MRQTIRAASIGLIATPSATSCERDTCVAVRGTPSALRESGHVSHAGIDEKLRNFLPLAQVPETAGPSACDADDDTKARMFLADQLCWWDGRRWIRRSSRSHRPADPAGTVPAVSRARRRSRRRIRASARPRASSTSSRRGSDCRPGSPNARCTPGTFSSCRSTPIISLTPRLVPNASSPTAIAVRRRCGSSPRTRCSSSVRSHRAATSRPFSISSTIGVSLRSPYFGSEVVADRRVADERAVDARRCREDFAGRQIGPVARADEAARLDPRQRRVEGRGERGAGVRPHLSTVRACCIRRSSRSHSRSTIM